MTQLAVHHQPAAGGHGGGITTAAVGLADGGVQLLRGDMSRERERLQRGRVNLGATGSTPAAVAGLELSKPGGCPLTPHSLPLCTAARPRPPPLLLARRTEVGRCVVPQGWRSSWCLQSRRN